jgi:thioredoxin type arsenate reductase
MDTLPAPPPILKLLGHDLRWQLVNLLAKSDLRVQELVEGLAQPQNLVSYHLHKLLSGGVVREQRSIADGREIYYSLDLERVKDLLSATGAALHPGLAGAPLESGLFTGPAQPQRVLFLCTHNSARSQMAEAILRARGGDQVEAHSAGTQPSRVHPLAIQAMREMGIDISDQRSKSLDEFLGQTFDAIVTVCDRAREACPVFPGDPARIHWSIPDPLEAQGSEAEQLEAFRETAAQLDTRIHYFLFRR